MYVYVYVCMCICYVCVYICLIVLSFRGIGWNIYEWDDMMPYQNNMRGGSVNGGVDVTEVARSWKLLKPYNEYLGCLKLFCVLLYMLEILHNYEVFWNLTNFNIILPKLFWNTKNKVKFYLQIKTTMLNFLTRLNLEPGLWHKEGGFHSQD